MFKKLSVLLTVLFMMSSVSYAQDFNYNDVAPDKKVFEPLVGWMASGSNAMTFNSASAPTVFGLRVGVMFAGASVPEIDNAESPGWLPNTAGVFVAGGTFGFEGYFRILPVDELNSMGFGLKYEFTKLLPLPPGFPVSLAGYFDYGSFGLKTGDGVEEVEFNMTNLGFGVLASADLVLINVYTKIGYETASGEIKYTYNPGIITPQSVSVKPDNGGLRLAVGTRLLFIDLEAGIREGSYVAAGISFGI